MAVLAKKILRFILLIFILVTLYIRLFGGVAEKHTIATVIKELPPRRPSIIIQHNYSYSWSFNNTAAANLNASLTSKIDEYLTRPMIFIVGAQSSGTSLMRLLLDVHPDVNCGDETSVTHRIVKFVNENILGTDWSVKFLADFGVKNETIEKATGLFVYYIMENNKKNPDFDTTKVKYLCNKGKLTLFLFCNLNQIKSLIKNLLEPDNSKYIGFFHKIFPNARFVYIIRDGRDAAYSYYLREKEAFTFLFRDIKIYLRRWNEFNAAAYQDCERIGEQFCFTIRYEQLVSDPEPVLRQLVHFLQLAWVDQMLHHDSFIGQNKLSISKDPIYKKFPRGKISNKSVGRWRGKIFKFKNRFYLEKHAPMLKTFNYID